MDLAQFEPPVGEETEDRAPARGAEIEGQITPSIHRFAASGPVT